MTADDTRTPIVAPHDYAAEQAVLGSLIASDRSLSIIAGEVGLKPDDFYALSHQAIYAGMLELADRGIGVDAVTLTSHLRHNGSLTDDATFDAKYIDSLPIYAPDVANVKAYAATVVNESRWRRSLAATYAMQEAIDARDRDKFTDAESQIVNPTTTGRKRTFTTDELGDRLTERITAESKPERFPWPFKKLNYKTRGGAARGQVTLIAGPTSHGKSVMCDMTLESFAQLQHIQPHLFLNEMSEEERTARVAGRLSGIEWDRIFSGDLNDQEKAVVASHAGYMKFGMTECAGWSARDICREARRHKYDAIAVDLVNKLPYRHNSRVHDLADASTEFNALAQDTGCHVLLVAHVNRNRSGAVDGRRPNPTLSDIKDCAALADDANNVLFVWRQQDEDTGDPLPEGVIRFGKARGGELGGLDVVFDGAHMKFNPAPARHLEAAA